MREFAGASPSIRIRGRLQRAVDTTWLAAATFFIAYAIGNNLSLAPEHPALVLSFGLAFAVSAATPMSFARGSYLVRVDLTDAVVLISLFYLDPYELLLLVIFGATLGTIRAQHGLGERIMHLADLLVTFAPATLLFSLPIGADHVLASDKLVIAAIVIAIPNLVFHLLFSMITGSGRLPHSSSRIFIMRVFNTIMNLAIAIIAIALLKSQPVALPALFVLVAAFVIASRGMRRTIADRDRLTWLVELAHTLQHEPRIDVCEFLADSLKVFYPTASFVIADYEPSGGVALDASYPLGITNSGPRWLLIRDPHTNHPALFDPTDEDFVSAAAAVVREYHSRHHAESRLKQATLHDPLTGLPSRRLLNELIGQTIANAYRSNAHCAVVTLNIDHFQTINDNHGHEIGDQVLLEVASRIRYVLRSNDILARPSGDDFVIVLPNVRAKSDVERVVIKIMDVLSEPLDIGDGIRVFSSLGAALFPENGQIAKELLHAAGTAMLEAKTDQAGWQFASNARKYRRGIEPAFTEDSDVDWQHTTAKPLS